MRVRNAVSAVIVHTVNWQVQRQTIVKTHRVGPHGPTTRERERREREREKEAIEGSTNALYSLEEANKNKRNMQTCSSIRYWWKLHSLVPGESTFGICEVVLSLFGSYLQGRTQVVTVSEEKILCFLLVRSPKTLSWDQIIFLLYTRPLSDVVTTLTLMTCLQMILKCTNLLYWFAPCTLLIFLINIW